MNTLVLRTDLSGNPTFRELLARVRERSLQAYAHQDVPFERLVEMLNPTRALSHHPVFQVMLAWDDTAQGDIEMPGLAVRPEFIETGTARMDLAFSLSEHRDGADAGVSGVVEFRTDVFERSSVESLIARWIRILEAVAVDPDMRVGAIDLLGEDERHRVLVEWNDPDPDPDPDAVAENMTVPELFARQVERVPDAVAVVCGDRSLTYAELDRESNRLARVLISRGVGPETVVAVALPRSADLIVALLGVLKAGGAYLPIDPGYPSDRLEFMLTDAAPVITVTDSDTAIMLPHNAISHLCLDTLGVDIVAEDGWGVVVQPQNLAYLTYTSGSTGVPKGVAITHRNVAAFVSKPVWRDGAHGSVLMHSSVAFDASTYEIWAPLTNGGRVVVAPPGRTDIATLTRVLAENGVTAAFLTTRLFELLLDECPDALASLHQVWTGGEEMPPEVFRRALRMCPRTRVVHVYGPTETTTFATCRAFEPAESFDGVSVPIGSALANMRVFVLDSWLSPVPIGVPGELHIAGAQLGRGYRGRAGLTASRFVADPFGPVGSRLYRTGDLVRWTASGELVFVGRVDDQVKVRGFRVELGEIESVLAAHPGVSQAVVVARDAGELGKQLVGYVVPGRTADVVDGGVVRRYVADRLPEFMVPATVVVLEGLPLTSNGKLDRRALPEPEFVSRVEYREPRDEQEQVLAGLFAEVLGLGRVGIDDNFFDLGGHSLLATRLISRIRTVLGVEVPIRTVFEAPTAARLAPMLGTAGSARAALTVQARPKWVPLSFAQTRLWFLHRLEGPSATYNMPIALRVVGVLDVSALRAAVGDVVARHEVLRTVFLETDGVPVQQVLEVGEVEVPVSVVDVEAGSWKRRWSGRCGMSSIWRVRSRCGSMCSVVGRPSTW
ncbi:amino acid adenylation domain protein [Rhodococcus sp. MTM3W5.2]|nr:amino acid adenylation domain protein [Rhodococcus sp. MTM3W5.2]